MIRPPPRFASKGAKARMAFAVPVRLTSIWVCQSSSSISSSGRKAWMPALACTMSRPPSSLSARAAAARGAGRSRWSRMMLSQRRPAALTSRPVSSRSPPASPARHREAAGIRAAQDVDADDVRALASESDGRGTADPACGTGDRGHLTAQTATYPRRRLRTVVAGCDQPCAGQGCGVVTAAIATAPCRNSRHSRSSTGILLPGK